MSSSLHLPRPPGRVSEFRAFIARGSVVDLAVVSRLIRRHQAAAAVPARSEVLLEEIRDLLKSRV